MLKTSFFWLFVLTASLLSCHKKGLPTITTRTEEPPPPVAMAPSGPVDLAAGKAIYAVRCARCHDMPEVQKYKSDRWERILNRMIPRARLNKAEENNVRAYVMENCLK